MGVHCSLLPIGEFGRYPENLRAQFEGVAWKFRSSAQWRELAGRFGPWQTVYDRLHRTGGNRRVHDPPSGV
ncbi:transposase [Streptomyces sp. NPDC060053]|uniref:transposase n=1 Tax=Streptomyces sp. NPDC060053 TaxID=3347047 RepID=UPI0036C5BA95